MRCGGSRGEVLPAAWCFAPMGSRKRPEGVDDDDEIDRLLAGYDLARVEEHGEDDALPARLDDGEGFE